QRINCIWPSVKIINGHPWHSQSQGLVECANGILNGEKQPVEMIAPWQLFSCNKLFANNIFDEEEIPDTIEILNDDKTDLDDNMT
ncbi:25278_t:CDS:2, partial [Gigaspora rosea]